MSALLPALPLSIDENNALAGEGTMAAAIVFLLEERGYRLSPVADTELERLRKALNEALNREPTLEEIRDYDLDTGHNPRGAAFNYLQWKLDLVRALSTTGDTNER